MSIETVFDIAKRLGLEIRWFDKPPANELSGEQPIKTLVRSFFDAPNTVYLNRALEKASARLKFDLANQVAHKVLHDGDGARAPQV